MLTSVASASSRSRVNAPSTANAPTSSGSPAAAREPNTTASSTSRSGMDTTSARAMSEATCSSMSAATGIGPPRRVVTPGAMSSSAMRAYDSSRSCSVAPANSMATYVAVRSALAKAGSPPVDQ